MVISKPQDIFGIDLRTLALFRVLLGSFILLDLCLRARDLVAHYTDFGVVPRTVAIEYLRTSSFSLHLANGTATYQLLLFILAAAAAFMLIIGWHTRIATFVSWLLLLSLQNRNTVILSGEDNLLMVLLFWAMILPLGDRCSLDNIRSGSKEALSDTYFSLASAALLIQGMSMYFFSALLKSDDRWFPDGTAVYFALQLDYFATPFALWFRQFESILTVLTYYVHLLELIGPILIFSPLFFRPLRSILMVAFITMHIGFFLCLEIGAFPLIAIIMNLTFLPSGFWDRLFIGVKRLRLGGNLSNIFLNATHRMSGPLGDRAQHRLKPHLSTISVNLIAGFMLVFVSIQNLSTLPALNIELPRVFVNLRQLLGVYQNWTMFAPYPELSSPWPVIPGQLEDGTVVDVYRMVEGAPSFRNPDLVSAVYKNYRWRKYLSLLEDQSWESGPQRLALNYSRYLCRRWNTGESFVNPLASFDVYFVVERTLEPGQGKNSQLRRVWSHQCLN